MAEASKLLFEWDPLGISPYQKWPCDEYDCLVGPILSKLSQGATAANLARYMRKHLWDHMGIWGADTEGIAARLKAWFDAGPEPPEVLPS